MLTRASIPCEDGPPDLFQIHANNPSRYPFLLQSAPGAGRYDLLFAHPGEALTAAEPLFLERLGNAFEAEGPLSLPDDLPFLGGWFIYLGYEFAGTIEPTLNGPPSPHRLPDALAVRCRSAILYDHAQNTLELVSESESGLDELRQSLAVLDPAREPVMRRITAHCEEEPAERFTQGVVRILEYLAAGDVFQVNLSRLWRAQLEPGCGYSDVYRQLRRSNPAPYAGLLWWDGLAVISSSPERLVELRGRNVCTRPIAGTHPRAADEGEDRLQRQRLLASFKERAEHVMLIDLERNDLGRVCEPGSVHVDELMQLESYAHVHHIVSNVRGRLRADLGPSDVLRAVFPGGTITGCPKIRAMQIIGELEGAGRGPYTGAMGYLSRDGQMDMNILIRSIVCDGANLSFRTGAGIVADSHPHRELAETRAKARGMLHGLGLSS